MYLLFNTVKKATFYFSGTSVVSHPFKPGVSSAVAIIRIDLKRWSANFGLWQL